jgi:hypothetical protein
MHLDPEFCQPFGTVKQAPVSTGVSCASIGGDGPRYVAKCLPEIRQGPIRDCGRMTGKPVVIPGEKFALPVTWVRGIKLRLFAFSSVAASHDSFATGLRSGRPIFVLPLLRENKTPGCPIQRVLENDFVVVTGTGTARDFIRLLTVELH